MNPERSRIPWVRLFAEGCVIVVGILLAFGIDAWWDGRQARHAEQRLIANLRADFAQTLADLERVIGTTQRSREGALGLLARTRPDPADLPVARFDSLITELTAVASFDPTNGTLVSLLSSEGLGAISDPEIRNLLSSWSQEIEDTRGAQGAALQHWGSRLMPYLEEHVSMRKKTSVDRVIGHGHFMSDPVRILSDMHFENLLVTRLEWADVMLFLLQRTQTRAQEIKAVLDAAESRR